MIQIATKSVVSPEKEKREEEGTAVDQSEGAGGGVQISPQSIKRSPPKEEEPVEAPIEDSIFSFSIPNQLTFPAPKLGRGPGGDLTVDLKGFKNVLSAAKFVFAESTTEELLEEAGRIGADEAQAVWDQYSSGRAFWDFVGIAETGATLISGLGGSLVAGVGGVAAFALEKTPVNWLWDNTYGDRDEIASEELVDTFNLLQGAFTYDPFSEKGRLYTQKTVEATFGQLENLRQSLGETVAGEAIDARSKKLIEIESLDELAGIGLLHEQLGGTATTPSAKAEGLLGAFATIAPDIALAIAGGLIIKASRTTKGRHKGKPSPEIMVTDEGVPAAVGERLEMKLTALDGLENSKPKFSSPQEFIDYRNSITVGAHRPIIVVETIEGFPIRVISGQEGILVLKELKKQGKGTNNVVVHTLERIPEQTVASLASATKQSEAFVKSEKIAEKEAKAAKPSLKERALAFFVDTSANVKGRKLQAAGNQGWLAIRAHDLIAGATARSALSFQDAHARIFKGLSHSTRDGHTVLSEAKLSEWDLFNRLLRARRNVAIGRTKRPSDVPKFTGGAKPIDAANYISEMRRALKGTGKNPDSLFIELNARGDAYFSEMARLLNRMKEEGLISAKDFNNMKGIDYLKTEFIEMIDPIIGKREVLGLKGRQPISIGESGIEYFGRGSTKAIVLDSELHLAEIIGRVENRIARNKANQRLHDLAKDQPDNGVVKLWNPKKKDAKPPKGFEKISVRIKGKTKDMIMPEVLAQEWVAGGLEMTTSMANILRIGSGTALVKPLATGFNPEFALTNFPRDIVHAWHATTRQHSNFVPLAALQFSRDLIVTFADSALKKGRYVDYINEGGGMSFLTHQGRQAIEPSRATKIQRQLNPRLRKTQETLSYFNELSEVWVRLAIRERALQTQRRKFGKVVDPEEATWIARRYLDFSQGGTVTKGLDNVFPYLNAGSQALRTFLRAFKEDPVGTTLKDLQLVAMTLGPVAYSWIHHPETMKAIPTRTRYRNWIFPTDHFIIDANQNQRFVYTAIRKDQSLVPITAWAEMALDRYITGKPPTDSMFDYVKDALPITTLQIPVLESVRTYMSNYNSWFDDKVWKGAENIEPWAEIDDLPRNPTDPIFVDIGRLFAHEDPQGNLVGGVSPARLEASIRQLVPINTYMHLGTSLYRWATQEVDPRIAAQTTEEWISKTVVSRRVYKLTHPAAVELEKLDMSARVSNTKREIAFREMNKKLFLATIDPVKRPNFNDSMDFAKSFEDTDPFLAKSLIDRVIAKRILDEVFQKRKPDLNLTKVWWLDSLRLDSDARADVYFNEWLESSSAERRQMELISRRLSGGKPGGKRYRDVRFRWKLRQLENSVNTDPPVGVYPEAEGEGSTVFDWFKGS